MEALGKFRRAILGLLERLLILAMAAMLLSTLWGVTVNIASKLTRGLAAMDVAVLKTTAASLQKFLSSQAWTMEAATSMMVWAGLLGAALGFARKSHLGIDFIVEKLDVDSKTMAKAISHILAALFVAYVIVNGGFSLFRETNETLANLGVNKAWVYLALPVSGCFMLLFSVENLLETLFGKDAPEPDGKMEKE